MELKLLDQRQYLTLLKRENERKILSIKDFLKDCSKDINKLQLEGLVKAGAFDKLITTGNQYLILYQIYY